MKCYLLDAECRLYRKMTVERLNAVSVCQCDKFNTLDNIQTQLAAENVDMQMDMTDADNINTPNTHTHTHFEKLSILGTVGHRNKMKPLVSLNLFQ